MTPDPKRRRDLCAADSRSRMDRPMTPDPTPKTVRWSRLDWRAWAIICLPGIVAAGGYLLSAKAIVSRDIESVLGRHTWIVLFWIGAVTLLYASVHLFRSLAMERRRRPMAPDRTTTVRPAEARPVTNRLGSVAWLWMGLVVGTVLAVGFVLLFAVVSGTVEPVLGRLAWLMRLEFGVVIGWTLAEAVRRSGRATGSDR